MEKKSCLVTGVGWGTGNAIVRRFASSGYNVAMLARRDDRLAEMEKRSMEHLLTRVMLQISILLRLLLRQ